MDILNDVIIEGQIYSENLTAASTSFNFLTYNTSSFKIERRLLGTIITKNVEDYIDSFTVNLPTTIFAQSSINITNSSTSTSISLASQTKRTFLGAPNGFNGTPSFRELLADDVPVLTLDHVGLTYTDVTNWNNVANGYVPYADIRTIQPNHLAPYKLQFGFTSYNNNNTAPWADYIHFGGYGSGGQDQNLLVVNRAGFGIRQFQGTFQANTPYTNFVEFWHSGNFTQANINSWNNAASTAPTSALTAGSVIFSNGTNLTEDNANFKWDNVNKRLGIGTSSPTARLHLPSESDGIIAKIGRFDFVDAWQSTIKHAGYDVLTFQSGGGYAEFLVRLRASMGLDIGNGSLTSEIVVGGSSNGLKISSYDGIQFANRSFYNAPTTFTMNDVEMMRVGYDGKVRIGTNGETSAAKLNIIPGFDAGLPVLGSGSGSLFLAGHTGGWGTYFSHNPSTGEMYIQNQRSDGGSTVYPINLNPLGGNVTVNTHTIWHAGNLINLSQLTNDLGYVTSTTLNDYVPQWSLTVQLLNYVTIDTPQTIVGNKTFDSSPIVPAGTLAGHAINRGQIFNDNGATNPAYYRTLDGSLGVGLKVKLPFVTSTNKMVSFTLRIYGSYTSYDINFSGYLYGGNWYLPGAIISVASQSINIKMGVDADDKPYVWIPDFAYLSCAVINVVSAYNSGDWNTGWEFVRTNDTPNLALDTVLYPNLTKGDITQTNINTWNDAPNLYEPKLPTGGNTTHYLNGAKQWVAFPTITTYTADNGLTITGGNIIRPASGYIIPTTTLLATYALADGTNATNAWVNSSYALELNPTVPGKTFNSSGLTNLSTATYGSVAGIVNNNGIGVGTPTDDWYHRIKMLHNNAGGYYTEIAVAMTGTEAMYYKQFSGGSSIKNWIRVHDTTTITPTNINNWNTWGDHRTNGVNNYIGTDYVPGGNEKPNSSYFGAGKLKAQMLNGGNIGSGSLWNDVLYISTYTGGDIKGSNALVFGKNAEQIGFVRQDFDSASWGTYREIYHTGNFDPSIYATTSILTTNYLPLTGGTLSGVLYSNSTISVVSDGAGHDPYGRIGVTRGTASNFAYYGLTRSAQIGWSLGIDTSNRFIIGTGATTADKIITNTALALDQAGNVTATDFYTPTHGNSIQWNEAYTNGVNGVTLHTPQTIIAQKIFNGGSGDYYTEKAIMVNSNNSSLPGITFHKVGEYASIISLKLNEFNFLHLDGTNYANLKAAQYIVKDGTASQFLKADGSLDTNTYLTTSSAATNYVTKANVNENINGQKSFLKRAFVSERLGLKNLAGVEKIIFNSELSRIVVREQGGSGEVALFMWEAPGSGQNYPVFQLPPADSRLAIGCYITAHNGYNLLIGGSARVDQAMDAGLLRKIGSNDDEILRGAGDVARTDKEVQIQDGALRFVPEEFKFYSDGEVDTDMKLVHIVIYENTYTIDFRSISHNQTYKIWNLSSNSCFINIGGGFSISKGTMVEIYISDGGDKIITNEVAIGTL